MINTSVINTITNTGITPEMPFYLKNKLRVFNNANLAIFFIDIFYTIVGLVSHYPLEVGFTSFSILSTIAAYVLVRKGCYRIAFHYTIFHGFIFLSSFTFLFGTVSNSYLYFLFIPVAANILFDNSATTTLYGVLSVIIMALNIYYGDFFSAYYKVESWNRYFSYPNIVFSSLLIFMGVRLFKEENWKYSRQIEHHRKSLEEKNKEITDSINYAKKIQSALIPAEEAFAAHFREAFVILKPRDIVSGDFYCAFEAADYTFYVTSDCTGHGVPGGFMTMLGISFLDDIINVKSIHEPAEILNNLRDRIIHTLKQNGHTGENKDGMDIVVCRLDKGREELCYSGANNSVYIYSNEQFSEYKPDKQPCGFYHDIKPFTQHTVKVSSGDCIYTFTDGFADQFGGPSGKKFKYKQLEKLIADNSSFSMQLQKKVLLTAFENWRGALEQLDDVCLVGVKV